MLTQDHSHVYFSFLTAGSPVRNVLVNRERAQLYPRGADDFSQVDIHPVVTADQVTVVRLSILQLHQLRREATQQTLESLQHNAGWMTETRAEVFPQFHPKK